VVDSDSEALVSFDVSADVWSDSADLSEAFTVSAASFFEALARPPAAVLLASVPFFFLEAGLFRFFAASRASRSP
jgi:hypothetical protein